MLSSYISPTVIDGVQDLTFQAVQCYNKKKTAGESQRQNDTHPPQSFATSFLIQGPFLLKMPLWKPLDNWTTARTALPISLFLLGRVRVGTEE